MARPVNLQNLELHYKNRVIDYILQEMKKVIEGKGERKVICVSGNQEDLKNVVWRLKISAAEKNAKVVEKFSLSANEKKKVYVYKTSEINPGDDYWVGKYHPSFVLIIEDSREFSGECEKLRL